MLSITCGFLKQKSHFMHFYIYKLLFFVAVVEILLTQKQFAFEWSKDRLFPNADVPLHRIQLKSFPNIWGQLQRSVFYFAG